MTTGLDRAHPLPLHSQLKTALNGLIREHNLQPGDRLPSEKEIERKYGVSRTVIRQALSQLLADGVIERAQGKGTFVAPPRIRHASRLVSFTEDMRSQGLSPSHELLESVATEASDAVAERLQLGDRRTCWFLRRLHLANGHPVGIGESWLSMPHLHLTEASMADLTSGLASLYELFPRLGVELDRGTETVVADLANSDEARLLRRAPGTPLLRVERISLLGSGQPIELTRIAFLGDRYEYRTEIFPR